MTSWGDVNVVMNRLVREGLIEGFRTNRAQKVPELGFHVFITLPKSAGPKEAESMCKTIADKLVTVAEDVTVTVDHSEAGAA